MAEVPRRPTFPEHVVRKLIARILRQVEDDVIPVSTGIYTEEKLIEKLQAIPKPVLQDYDDKIFYELVQKVGICPVESCRCGQQFSNKHPPVMCHFCSRWNCDDCLSERKRLHPLNSNPNGERFAICCECDEKFLQLQLHHPYVENKMLIEQAILVVSKQLEDWEDQVEKKQARIQTQLDEPRRKLLIRQSIIKKQQLELNKLIQKALANQQQQKQKHAKLLEQRKELEQRLRVFTQNQALQKKTQQNTRKSEDDRPLSSEQEQPPEEDSSSSSEKRLEQNERVDDKGEDQAGEADSEKGLPTQEMSGNGNHLEIVNFEAPQVEAANPVSAEQFKDQNNKFQYEQDDPWAEDRRQKFSPQDDNQTFSFSNSTMHKDPAQDNDRNSEARHISSSSSDNKSGRESYEGIESQAQPMMEYFSETQVGRLSTEEKLFREFNNAMEMKEMNDEREIEAAKQNLLKEAIMKQRQWNESQAEAPSVDGRAKCQCAMF